VLVQVVFVLRHIQGVKDRGWGNGIDIIGFFESVSGNICPGIGMNGIQYDAVVMVNLFICWGQNGSFDGSRGIAQHVQRIDEVYQVLSIVNSVEI
jgi:hypothetical protein